VSESASRDALGVGEGPSALIVRDVNKTFEVPEQRVDTLKERVLHPRRRIEKRRFTALQNISFDVGKGEFFGIAGRNGSGKSTLLKIMAGIYGTDGKIWRNGRMSTFIELGVGLNPELAARENVIMNGIMMGLTAKEARKRFQSVIEFAELEEFAELKLKNYSSGMHVRLAFATSIQVDADILLIDEVLAVGDAAFQQKCFDVFNDLRDNGKTIVFVTHDMGSLRRFCHRAMLLERGEMVYIGDPEQVGDRYLELNFGRSAEAAAAGADGHAGGDGDARVTEVWIEDEAGERRPAVQQHQRVTLHAAVRFMVDVSDPSVSVYILNEEHKAILIVSTVRDHDHTGDFRAGEEAVFSFAFHVVLAPGRYSPMVNIAHRGAGVALLDQFKGEFSFVVTGTDALGGLIDLPVEVSARRVDGVVLPELAP
jgi:ABC-type polysaccharide/polyol phosphate transport system ATPase subunit